MNSFRITAAAGAALAMLAAAQGAAAQDGRLQVKVFATRVVVDGGITDVKLDRIPLPAGSDTNVTNDWAPTIAAEYFITPRISVETICCTTQHDVRGAGAVQGAELIDNADLVPATVTLKYHFPLDGGVKPYVGAGPAYFMLFGESVGASARRLGATHVDLTSELGVALQAGVDVPFGDRGLSVSLDVKRYFVDTTARFSAGGARVLESEHSLDPWVASAGLAWRF